MPVNALTKRKKAATRFGYGEGFFGVFTIFCLLLLLKNADVAIEYMQQGILLCTRSVLPSLFPFMVLSELLVSYGDGKHRTPRFSPPFQRLWGLSPAGLRALLLGLLCGFPVGARCARLGEERGEMKREEADRILCFGSLPSSAFLMNAVGLSLWGSRPLGVTLYLSSVAVALLSVALFAPRKNRKKEKEPPMQASSAVPSFSTVPRPLVSRFTDAVCNAARSIFLVCAYVLFFSAISGALTAALANVSLPAWAEALFFGFLELSGGMSYAAAMTPRTVGALFSAFFVGWGGISVHFQLLSLCKERPLSVGRYLMARLWEGLLCAAIMGIALWLCPSLLLTSRPM